jgi:hypothetical protein
VTFAKKNINCSVPKNSSTFRDRLSVLKQVKKKMTTELFLDNFVHEHSKKENPYYDYFMNSSGKGSSVNLKRVEPRIGYIYTQSPYFQRGYGRNIGGAFHRKQGGGIGTTLSSLFTRALPFIKRGAQTLGSAASDVVSNIMTDVIEGKNVKESAIEHVKNKGKEILQDIPSNIKGILKKTDEQIPQEISSPRDLAAPTPTKFRRIAGNRKRRLPPPKQLGATAAKQRKKYPALKRFQ